MVIKQNSANQPTVASSKTFWRSIIVCRGEQGPTWKKKYHQKCHFPTRNEITLVQEKLSVQTKIKFLFTPISNICFKKTTGVKLTIGRLLLIHIYWYQSTNRKFIPSNLFIHSHKGGLNISLMIKSPLWEYIDKLENYT